MLCIKQNQSSSPLAIWSVAITFVLFQFFLQLSSGVIISALSQELALTAVCTGVLSSAFYYVYTALQIPVGLLFDSFNARYLISFNALLCALGCYIFAHSHDFMLLMLSRLMIGAGASFAFIGISHILRSYFPLSTFGFMIGLSETLAFLITVLGMFLMGVWISGENWRELMNHAGLVGLMIALCCFCYIPNHTPVQTSALKPQLKLIVSNPRNWANGLFGGCGFTLMTTFGALWAIPFIQIKMQCSLQTSSMVDAALFLGAAISCPLFGILAQRVRKRNTLLRLSYFCTFSLLCIILYVPISNLYLLALLLLFMGISCGAYMLAYSISNELAPKNSLSTCTGFTNTLAVICAPILQPFIGFLLEYFSKHTHVHSLLDYQKSLSILPLSLLIGIWIIQYLPEKRQETRFAANDPVLI
ncbi:MAG: MFS transporter [Legionellaceae bacterium]|nr:MFS transporter [Legionellaceae bacterium]